MRVGSSSSLHGLSSVCLLPCPSWGWSWLPLPGLTSPVWSSGRFWLLGAGSRPVSPLRSLAPSHSGVCAVRVCPHLVSSLTAARLGLWPYGLAIAALPLVSRPWTGLCWSHLLSLGSVSVCSWFYRASWLAQGCIPLLRPFALLLAF